ncbi:hypothetical protein IFM89_033715 [Coptis chinensis]|uniref:Cupin type-1 domain-containing protein n=1 Tax=Coptis chinensis TaxID=261450 RepID=A0A835H299_9MAGN|nr:hypothetical protein IFM89_033715 [Coptis chinensis]
MLLFEFQVVSLLMMNARFRQAKAQIFSRPRPPTTPPVTGPTISAAKYICRHEAHGDWKRRSPFSQKPAYNAWRERGNALNLWRERVDALEQELMATKRALEDALVREKELEAYVDKKKKKKNKLKKLLHRVPHNVHDWVDIEIGWCCSLYLGEVQEQIVIRLNHVVEMITARMVKKLSVDIPLWRKPTPKVVVEFAMAKLRLLRFYVKITDGVFVNGKFCKDPKLATANDFFFSGLHMPGNTSNQLGSAITPANVAQIPGLNTLGISLARVDFAPYGLTSPHTHPRATEIVVVVEGTLYVGFVTSNPDNRFITKVLYQGDVFVIPVGLIHFQFNTGNTQAVAFVGISSQNPGVITIANNIFGSNPPISDDVLAKAFQLDKNVVDNLQAKFGMDIA